MTRLSHRLTIAILTLALLVLPAAAQATPDRTAEAPTWSFDLLGALDDLVQGAWSALEGLVPGSDPTDDTTLTTTANPDDTSTIDTSTEVKNELDPNG